MKFDFTFYHMYNYEKINAMQKIVVQRKNNAIVFRKLGLHGFRRGLCWQWSVGLLVGGGVSGQFCGGGD